MKLSAEITEENCAKLLSQKLCFELFELRNKAKEGRDPTCADGTLFFLFQILEEIGKGCVLEIGAAEGLTACALLSIPGVRYTGIELDPGRAKTARENLDRFGFQNRAVLHEGDAAEILPLLSGSYDIIFLDGPKAQYLKFLPDCKRLLKRGGYLLSDDVLLFGWVRGEPPKKRRMLIEHIRTYLSLLENDPDFSTQIYEIGEGLAVSKKL